MKIDILSVGKIKEKYFVDAINEYSKRISKFSSVNIIEVKDEMTPDGCNPRQVEIIKSKEAERLMAHIKPSAYIVALCIEGKELSSEELADKIVSIQNDGFSHIQFIIGGSLGIADELKALSKFKLSFSKMTFPHQLMRVVLLEQVYRAFKIMNNEPYHK